MRSASLSSSLTRAVTRVIEPQGNSSQVAEAPRGLDKRGRRRGARCHTARPLSAAPPLPRTGHSCWRRNGSDAGIWPAPARSGARSPRGTAENTRESTRVDTSFFHCEWRSFFLMHFMFIYARRDPHPSPRRTAARCSLSFETRATSTASPSWRDRHGGCGQGAEHASLRSAPDSTRVIKHVYN